MVIFHGELLNNQRVLIFDCLVVSTPLKNISQLGCLFPIHGKIIHMFQTTNQLMLISSIQNRAKIQRALQHLRSLLGSQSPASRTRWMTGFWLILRVPIDARMVPIVLSTIIYRIHYELASLQKARVLRHRDFDALCHAPLRPLWDAFLSFQALRQHV